MTETNEFDAHAVATILPAIRDSSRQVGDDTTVEHDAATHRVVLSRGHRVLLTITGVGSTGRTVAIARYDAPLDTGRSLADLTRDWIVRLTRDVLAEDSER